MSIVHDITRLTPFYQADIADGLRARRSKVEAVLGRPCGPCSSLVVQRACQRQRLASSPLDLPDCDSF